MKRPRRKGKKLKFVASYENGKASVGLQHVGPRHDFFHLYGKIISYCFILTVMPNSHW